MYEHAKPLSLRVRRHASDSRISDEKATMIMSGFGNTIRSRRASKSSLSAGRSDLNLVNAQPSFPKLLKRGRVAQLDRAPAF